MSMAESVHPIRDQRKSAEYLRGPRRGAGARRSNDGSFSRIRSALDHDQGGAGGGDCDMRGR